jgi:predicted nuclease with TOPRIM domain
MSEPSENPDRQFQLDVLGLLSAVQAGLAKTSESLTSNVLEIRSSQTGVTSRLDQIVVDQVELRDSIRQIGADQVEIRDSIRPIIVEQIELRDSVRQIGADQIELRDSVRQIGADQVGLRDSVRQIGADQVELRDSIRQVGADQTRLRVEVMARIDRLQATVDLVREDARVNWATADTAMNRVKNYREEIDHLTAMISAMERRYQSLAAVVDDLRDRDAKRPNGS